MSSKGGARLGLVSLGAAALLVAAPVARVPSRPTPGRIATIDARAPGVGASVSLVDATWTWAAQREPVGGGTLRPVVLRAVHDVHRLEIEGDRGREIVRLDLCGGPDPRLPDELVAYLRGPARAALETWLSAPGTRLYEATPAYEAGGETFAMPAWPGVDGARVVLLRRFGWDDAHGADVGAHARAQGWTYPSPAFTDALALDPRLPFRDVDETAGLGTLPSVRAMRRAFAEDAARLEAMAPEAFQAMGERLTVDVAAWLGWRPRAALEFVIASPDEALAPITRSYQGWIDAIPAATEAQARRYRQREEAAGRRVEVRVEVSTPPAAELARGTIDDVHGFSPAGPRIWLLAKGGVTPALVEPLLVHEIVHQYQEEIVYPSDGPFPPLQLGAHILEAHAELLTAAWARRARGLGPDYHGVDYVVWVRDLEAILEALALAPDEAARRLHDEDWDVALWNRLARGEIGVQEWLFRQERRGDVAGLVFTPEPDALGRPGARITNTAATTFHGQLTGPWLWSHETDGAPALSQVELGPVNLVLPAGASVHVVVFPQPLWADGAPIDAITGLVSPTPWPVER